MSVAEPYRIVQTSGGVPIRLMEQAFPLRRDAEAWVTENRTSYGPRYKVIRHEEVPDIHLAVRAGALKKHIRNHSYLIATDFDDARERLLKIADKLDREMAREQCDRPAPGWLKTETALRHLYECFYHVTERRRVTQGNYTAEERNRMALMPANRLVGTRVDVIGRDIDADYNDEIVALATASMESRA
jgi:hypothetical protein